MQTTRLPIYSSSGHLAARNSRQQRSSCTMTFVVYWHNHSNSPGPSPSLLRTQAHAARRHVIYSTCDRLTRGAEHAVGRCTWCRYVERAITHTRALSRLLATQRQYRLAGAASFCERCALLYNQLQRAARAQVRDSIWFAPPDWRMRQQRDSRCAIELRRLFEIGELELPAIWGSIRHYSSITLLAMCGCTTPYFISLFNSLSCTVNFSFSRRLIIFLLKSTASYSSVDSDIFFTHNNKAYI